MLLVEGFVKEEDMKTEADELILTRFCSSKWILKLRLIQKNLFLIWD
jgi:hypothetical protein